MLILEIAADRHSSDLIISYENLMNGKIYNFNFVQASSLSFITSIRIAAECKHISPDLVVVHNEKDAMAAISARKINTPYPIVLYLTSSNKIPKSLPKDIAEGLNGIIYDNETTLSAWSKVKNIDLVNKKYIIPLPGNDRPVIQKEEKDHTLTLGFIGPLVKPETLSRMITDLAQIEDTRLEVVVIGTAKARYITPIIKRAKANKLPILWLGDNYDIEEIIGRIEGFIPSSASYTNLEKRCLANGIPPVTASNLKDWLNKAKREEMRISCKKEYKEKYTSERFISNLSEVINSL